MIQYLRRPPFTGLVYRNELDAGRRQALPPKFLRRTRRLRGVCALEREMPNREKHHGVALLRAAGDGARGIARSARRRLIEQQHRPAMFLFLLRGVIGDFGEGLGRAGAEAGPTARLIEEKKPAELTRQTIAREIEAAFAAEAKSGPIRLPATIFVVAARRPVFNAIKPQGRFPGSLSAPYWRFDPHRHMPRMRAAISTRTPLLAPLGANSGSASGHATLSKSPSSSSGMKRVREA